MDIVGKGEPAAWIEYDAGPEPQTFSPERRLHPFDVLSLRVLKLEVPDLRRGMISTAARVPVSPMERDNHQVAGLLDADDVLRSVSGVRLGKSGSGD